MTAIVHDYAAIKRRMDELNGIKPEAPEPVADDEDVAGYGITFWQQHAIWPAFVSQK